MPGKEVIRTPELLDLGRFMNAPATMNASTLVELAPRVFTAGPSRAWSSPFHSSSTGEEVPS